MTLFIDVKIVVLCVGVFVLPVTQALYNEAVSEKQLNELFVDDDCIEGTLASVEAAAPKLKLSIISDESFLSSKGNKSHNEVGLVTEIERSNKSPLSLVSELAQLNRVEAHYDVVDEKGPAHNKRYVVKLKLGREEYEGEGSSIKGAQREAARFALNSTLLQHPPDKPKPDDPGLIRKTSVQKLYDWVSKRLDVKLKYYYFEETENVFDLNDYFHSKPENIFRVIVKINDKEYSGIGPSIFTAKENAANLALSDLKNLDGLCPFNNEEGGILAKLFGYDLDGESPVSLINEFGLKSSVKTSLSLHSEEGPAHLKHFVYKCSVGNHETFGEGSCKKESKREAARKMIEILKAEAFHSAEICSKILKMNKKGKRKKSKNLTKSFQPQPSYYEEDDSEVAASDTPFNPVSKLYQIQQRSHGVEPVFKLIKESGGVNKEFSIQVFVGEMSCIGSGPNKKAAKRNAAEEMLKKLGYRPSYNTEQKKKDFMVNHNFPKAPLDSDIKLNSDLKFLKTENKPSLGNINSKVPNDFNNAGQNKKSFTTKNTQKQSKTSTKKTQKQSETSKTRSIEPMKDLKSLAKNLGIKFEFYDFPKENKMGFVSLLSLTTNPPKVCKGSGETVNHSQEKAAISALENLYKSQLEMISNVLEKTEETKEEIKEPETIVELFVNTEKE